MFSFYSSGFFFLAPNVAWLFGIKFVLAIALLILVRGGTPRYRYDYLTKLGWLKFLAINISVFLTTVLLFFFF